MIVGGGHANMVMSTVSNAVLTENASVVRTTSQELAPSGVSEETTKNEKEQGKGKK